MINNINKTGQIFNTSNQNLVTQQQNSESISIFSDSSKKLSKEEKKALKQAEKEERNRIKNNPDGIIQGGRQGSSAGDCWLLAQMNSMSKTDWGKEALKNASAPPVIKHKTPTKNTYIVNLFFLIYSLIKITTYYIYILS